MSLTLEKFKKAQSIFDKERNEEEGNKIMQRVTNLINELGQNFNTLDGGGLANIQIKLAGYKFYLADYISDLNRIFESIKIELKEIRAKRWEEISETIRAEKGKVKNKEEIENILVIETRELADEQILYETMYFRYKLKISALDDVLTAVCQQLAAKKREIETVKSIQN